MVGAMLGTSTQARLSSLEVSQMAEEVVVTSDREDPYPRPRLRGPSSLQTGLLYGAGGAAIGGPVGLLAGLFAGILHKRAKESYLDHVARDMHNTRQEYRGLQDEIKSELAIADPDEARLLENAQRIAADGWYRLQSGDESGRSMIEQANETIRGIMNADIQARKVEQAAQFNTQRGLITSAAPALRDQYSGVINQTRQIDSLSQRVLSLTADPNFDPNKPFNRAVIADMIQVGGGMFRDNPEGFWAGLAAGGAGTIVGSIAQGVDVLMDTEKFKLTREDFNRLALNARAVAQQYGAQRLEEIAAQAEGLDAFARQVGAIPQEYSLRDYVSGGVQELQVAPAISIPNIRPNDVKQTDRSAQTWKPRTSGPPRRTRPQLQAETPSILSDDWFRQQIGIPTQRRRRPTN